MGIGSVCQMEINEIGFLRPKEKPGQPLSHPGFFMGVESQCHYQQIAAQVRQCMVV